MTARCPAIAGASSESARCLRRRRAHDGAATERAITIDASVDALDWAAVSTSLNEYGNAVLSGILTPQECDALMGIYPNDDAFRSHVVMERHGFGRGEYKVL